MTSTAQRWILFTIFHFAGNCYNMYLQDHNLTIYLWQSVVTGDLQQDVIKIIIQLRSCTNIILNYSVSSSPHYYHVPVTISRAKSCVSCWNGLILHSPARPAPLTMTTCEVQALINASLIVTLFPAPDFQLSHLFNQSSQHQRKYNFILLKKRKDLKWKITRNI